MTDKAEHAKRNLVGCGVITALVSVMVGIIFLSQTYPDVFVALFGVVVVLCVGFWIVNNVGAALEWW